MPQLAQRYLDHIAFGAKVRQVLTKSGYVVTILDAEPDGRLPTSQALVWHGGNELVLLALPGTLLSYCQIGTALPSVVVLQEMDRSPWPQVAALHGFNAQTGETLWSLPGVELAPGVKVGASELAIVPSGEPDASPVWIEVTTGQPASIQLAEIAQQVANLYEGKWIGQDNPIYMPVMQKLIDLGHEVDAASPILMLEADEEAHLLFATLQKHWSWLVVGPQQRHMVDWSGDEPLAISRDSGGNCLLVTVTNELFWYRTSHFVN